MKGVRDDVPTVKHFLHFGKDNTAFLCGLPSNNFTRKGVVYTLEFYRFVKCLSLFDPSEGRVDPLAEM